MRNVFSLQIQSNLETFQSPAKRQHWVITDISSVLEWWSFPDFTQIWRSAQKQTEAEMITIKLLKMLQFTLWIRTIPDGDGNCLWHCQGQNMTYKWLKEAWTQVNARVTSQTGHRRRPQASKWTGNERSDELYHSWFCRFCEALWCELALRWMVWPSAPCSFVLCKFREAQHLWSPVVCVQEPLPVLHCWGLNMWFSPKFLLKTQCPGWLGRGKGGMRSWAWCP